METLLELKGQAYDKIAMIEAHQNQISLIQNQLAEINQKIANYKEPDKKPGTIPSK